MQFNTLTYFVSYGIAPMQSVNAGPSSAKQHALLEVENMLMEVQQARRDLESHSALAEAQQSWKDPLPPVTSDDL